MDTTKTINHQQQTLAITRAFDNLAKAAAQVKSFISMLIKYRNFVSSIDTIKYK